jgi:hypothetical protein
MKEDDLTEKRREKRALRFDLELPNNDLIFHLV